MKYQFLASVLALVVAMTLAGCQSSGNNALDDLVGTIGDDAPLSLKVRQALQSSPQTRRLNIDVATLDDGTTVRLAGFVNNEAERHEAERIAGQVEGVVHVANTISVR
ncbi:MAG: hypothetical protein CSB44_01215 [Gammaproteobacteria bacterium]|nr:MAG: hypothetical protein CSB44_01215 [Gammaproteobacteria bacterium]PIE38604.1 MAG: hypothetical protein CSA54_00115 [Gammaproteobacteria bacterium]